MHRECFVGPPVPTQNKHNELVPGCSHEQTCSWLQPGANLYFKTTSHIAFQILSDTGRKSFFSAGCTHIVFSGLPGTEHSLPGIMPTVVPGKYFAPGCSQDRLDPNIKRQARVCHVGNCNKGGVYTLAKFMPGDFIDI